MSEDEPLLDDLEGVPAIAPCHWTNRAVEFTPYPRTDRDKWEALFDSLADHYWERPWSRFFQPSLSACNLVIEVGSLPWWLPRSFARRQLAALALKHGVGGDVRYIVERTVLD